MSNAWDWLLHLSDNLESGILALVESWWVYPSVFAVSLVDAVIPMVPSESVVIGTASAWQAVGKPILPLIFLVAAAGAWSGDQIAYFIGTRVDVRRIKVFRRPKVLAALDWAEASLETRGPLFIIAGRFIPMGRVAVNLSAGALRYPRRRFMVIDSIAAGIWAAWGILIGTAAASLLHDNVVLSIIVGIVGGVLLGMLVDVVMKKFGLAPPELPDLAGDIEHDFDVHAAKRFHAKDAAGGAGEHAKDED